MSRLLVAGALVQIAAFALVHGSARELLTVTIATAASLLVAHEVLLEPSLARAAGGLLRATGNVLARR
jgi:hypothetical protein